MCVTIVMPAWNAADFLAEAVASVRRQTHADWELVVVDDGSTDGTLEIARSLAAEDERIGVLSQPNRGQGAARNRGADASRRRWLAFLDADDLWVPTTLAALMELGAQAEMVFGRAVPFSGRAPTPDAISAERSSSRPFCLSGVTGLTRLIRRNIVPLGATLLRRECFTALGGFDSRAALRNVEDYQLWLRILSAGYRLMHQPHAELLYRIHSANASRSRLDMKRRRINALQGVPLRHPWARAWRQAKLLELRLGLWRGGSRQRTTPPDPVGRAA